MHTSNSSNLSAWCFALVAVTFFSCATRKAAAQDINCYRNGISIVTELNHWDEQIVKVGGSLVEFNYYASLFADTLSQITGAPLDSFILFTADEKKLSSDVDSTVGAQVTHSLFLSLRREDYYFIEKVPDYAEQTRPNFGTGTIYLIKCTNANAQIIFSKALDYN